MPTPAQIVAQQGSVYGPIQILDPLLEPAHDPPFEVQWHDPTLSKLSPPQSDTWSAPENKTYAVGSHKVYFIVHAKGDPSDVKCRGQLPLVVGKFAATWELYPVDQAATYLAFLKTPKETQKLLDAALAYFEWVAGCKLKDDWMVGEWVDLVFVGTWNGADFSFSRTFYHVVMQTPDTPPAEQLRYMDLQQQHQNQERNDEMTDDFRNVSSKAGLPKSTPSVQSISSPTAKAPLKIRQLADLFLTQWREEEQHLSGEIVVTEVDLIRPRFNATLRVLNTTKGEMEKGLDAIDTVLRHQPAKWAKP